MWTWSSNFPSVTIIGGRSVWHPVLEKAFEISSMGIRVDQKTLENQPEMTGTNEKADLHIRKSTAVSAC
jgi:aspartate--ammonia ligase